MSGGFNNPIIGGGGSLVYPSVHSPNFNQATMTGWNIDKNGNAYFYGIVTSGSFVGSNFIINATGTFFYDGTPGVGNLIASVTGGGSFGNDSFGNPYIPGTATYQQGSSALGVSIYGNTISWYQLSGGVWGPTGLQIGNNGPSVDCMEMVAAATTFGGFLFSTSSGTTKQTAALIEIADGAGIAGVNGTNSWVRTTQTDGHPIENREIELANIGSAPTAPGGGVKIYPINGKFYVIGEDTNNLSVGDLRLIGTGNPQLVNSAGFTTVAGLTCELAAGITYEVEGKILLEGVAAAAGNPEFQFNGTSTLSTMHIDGLFYPNTGATIATNGANAAAFASSMIGQVLALANQQVFKFEGIMTCSVTGTMHLDAACSVAADTYDIFGTRSYMNVKPV